LPLFTQEEGNEMKNAGLIFPMKSLAAIGLLVGSLALWASPAAAQRSDEMKGGGGHPCAGDAQRICSEFIPDRAKVASCLFKNKAQLSGACRAEIGGGKAKVGKSRKGKRHGRRHRR
jgi:hypothetical protein